MPTLRQLFFILCCVFSISNAQANALEKLQRFLQSAQTLRADFSQTVTAKNGKTPQISSGVMFISRPGKFRWQIERPYSQLLVGDGEKIWIYDPDLKQVTVKKMDEALGNTPAALLIGGGRLEKDFDLSALPSQDGLDWVAAIPHSKESGFEKLLLGFAGNSADLKAMELFDNFGQITRLTFSRLERNRPISPALFTFSPPDGADVIGP